MGLCMDFYGGIVEVYKLRFPALCLIEVLSQLDGGPLNQVVEMQDVFQNQEVGQRR